MIRENNIFTELESGFRYFFSTIDLLKMETHWEKLSFSRFPERADRTNFKYLRIFKNILTLAVSIGMFLGTFASPQESQEDFRFFAKIFTLYLSLLIVCYLFVVQGKPFLDKLFAYLVFGSHFMVLYFSSLFNLSGSVWRDGGKVITSMASVCLLLSIDKRTLSIFSRVHIGVLMVIALFGIIFFFTGDQYLGDFERLGIHFSILKKENYSS